MKTLIVYFFYSNNTKNLVTQLNKEFNFDVVRVERKIAYSDDYDICAYVEAKEEVEKKIHPQIKKLDVDYSAYDRILLFFPIWWYTIPMPIASFIDSIKGFSGEIVVFANSYTNDPLLQRGIIVVCKSTHLERIKENFDVFDFILSEEDMQVIKSLDQQNSLFFNHQDPKMVEWFDEMVMVRRNKM